MTRFECLHKHHGTFILPAANSSCNLRDPPCQYIRVKDRCLCGIDTKLQKCELYLSEIQEETGILSSLRQVRQEDCDADQENRGVLAHLTQRL